MQWTAWIGLAAGMVMISSSKLAPPPVVLDLGPVVPTPVPTAKGAEKKRLITTITVQNTADGDSVVSFEASDVADEGKEKVRPLASKTYSLADDKPELKDLRQRIIEQLRTVERDMLDYAEKAGPPKERAPMLPSGGQSGGGARPR